MNNQQLTPKKTSFSVAINTTAFQKSILNTLQNPERARRFTAAIVSAVSNNQALQECETASIVSAALLGESLNLSPSPQLGQYYLVPFNKKLTDENGKAYYEKHAQFQLGYKGYIQLAIRSGQYKKLNVLAVKEGELIRFDPLNEEIEVRLIEDEAEREAAATIGYYAMFEYTNGFRKALYWSREKMERHANQYSQGYKARKGYTFWEKDFDGMAYKTMLRQLISKWGIMSIEMQEAVAQDITPNDSTDSTDFFEEAAPAALPVQGEPVPAALPVQAEKTGQQAVSLDDIK